MQQFTARAEALRSQRAQLGKHADQVRGFCAFAFHLLAIDPMCLFFVI